MQTEVKILSTADIHGCFYPMFSPAGVSLSRAVRYMHESVLSISPDCHLILDAGDFLSGGPANYYSHFAKEASADFSAREAISMAYDAMTLGNHDLELGPEVMEKFSRHTSIPLLGANVPEGRPYEIFTRGGIRMAVIGLSMPPFGRPLSDPEPYLRHAIGEIRAREHVDLTLGLFHLGPDDCSRLASDVDGIDAIFCGHEHSCRCVRMVRGHIPVINPGPRSEGIGEAVLVKDGEQQARIAGVRIADLRTAQDDAGASAVPPELSGWCGELVADFGCAIRLQTILERALLMAVKADVAMAPDTGTILDGPQRIIDTFRWLPYEDYAVAVTDSKTGRTVATTAHYAVEHFTCSPLLQVSELPVRHYLIESMKNW